MGDVVPKWRRRVAETPVQNGSRCDDAGTGAAILGVYIFAQEGDIERGRGLPDECRPNHPDILPHLVDHAVTGRRRPVRISRRTREGAAILVFVETVALTVQHCELALELTSGDRAGDISGDRKSTRLNSSP